MNQQTEQVHKDLRDVLLSGRILINGLPLTGNEMGIIIQGEQMLYEKATQLDKASQSAAKGEEPKVPGEKSNIVPIRKPEKK